MNLLQLAQRAHRETGRSGTGPSAIATAIDEHRRLFDWIADEWRELQARPIEWRWMRKTATATSVVGLQRYTGTNFTITDLWKWRPESPDYTVKVYLTADPGSVWRLDWLDRDQFNESYVDSQVANGRPMDWSIADDDALLIGPAADSTLYTIKAEYKKQPTELLLDTDVPDFDTKHHMMLVWRALIEAGKFDNAGDMVARGSSHYTREEQSLLSEYAPKLQLGGSLLV